MPQSPSRQPVESLRSNQDVFLMNLMASEEFQQIKQKYDALAPHNLFHITGRPDLNKGIGREVSMCAEEVSKLFRISHKTAVTLLLTPNDPSLYGLHYAPIIYRDGDHVILRFGSKTTLGDIKHAWSVVKEIQREIGTGSVKKSINPELAYCIHRQHVINGKKMADIFKDYAHGRLEGYEGRPATLSENDFRKYYKGVVEGL